MISQQQLPEPRELLDLVHRAEDALDLNIHVRIRCDLTPVPTSRDRS